MAGRDARIGIHAEQLRSSENTEAAHSDAMVTVTGNVVYGPFRRSIVFENMANCVATGNTVADATWWCLAMIGTSSCTMANNTVLYTRSNTDTQGSAWSPQRGPITIYGQAIGCILSGNTVITTGYAHAFLMFATASSSDHARNTLIEGNNFYCAANDIHPSPPLVGNVPIGIDMSNSIGTRFCNNIVSGFSSAAFMLSQDSDVDLVANVFDGIDGTPHGAKLSGTVASGSTLISNRFKNMLTAIELVNQTGTTARSNTIENCSAGVTFTGSSNCEVTGTTFTTVSTKYSGLSASNRVDTVMTAVSSDYAASVADGTIIATGSITITLPAASAVNPDWYHPIIKNAGIGSVTVSASPSTISGGGNAVIAPGNSINLASDGANYW